MLLLDLNRKIFGSSSSPSENWENFLVFSSITRRKACLNLLIFEMSVVLGSVWVLCFDKN